jgi:hypothetical protein
MSATLQAGSAVVFESGSSRAQQPGQRFADAVHKAEQHGGSDATAPNTESSGLSGFPRTHGGSACAHSA